MKTIKFLLILVVLAGFAGREGKKPNWPEYILNSMWIPPHAKHVKYGILDETYQAAYQINERYPGSRYLNDMVREMTTLGWQRRKYDFLNPTYPMSHARPPHQQWGYVLYTKGMLTCQWFDDWQDAQGNIVRYILRYIEKEKAFQDMEKMNTLMIDAIYIPAKNVLEKQKRYEETRRNMLLEKDKHEKEKRD